MHASKEEGHWISPEIPDFKWQIQTKQLKLLYSFTMQSISANVNDFLSAAVAHNPPQGGRQGHFWISTWSILTLTAASSISLTILQISSISNPFFCSFLWKTLRKQKVTTSIVFFQSQCWLLIYCLPDNGVIPLILHIPHSLKPPDLTLSNHMNSEISSKFVVILWNTRFELKRVFFS